MITRAPLGTWETLPFPLRKELPELSAYELQIRYMKLCVLGWGGTENGGTDGIARRRELSAARWVAGSRIASDQR